LGKEGKKFPPPPPPYEKYFLRPLTFPNFSSLSSIQNVVFLLRPAV
jgi:hypothetical protein